MSAQWLPVLASPKTSNKHLGRKGQVTFSGDAFDKLVASANISLQNWPRMVPHRAEFRVLVEATFPGFWARAEGVGVELATRLVMAAGRAAETGAAVKIPAGDVFLYKAKQLGFAQKKNHSYFAERERARQFVARRGGGSSASRILKDAVNKLGMQNHCSIAVYAAPSATHVVLIPHSADADVGRVYTAGRGDQFYLAAEEAGNNNNHVSRYMTSVPVGRWQSTASRQQILQLIDERCSHAGYREILKETVIVGMASDFRSNYIQEHDSQRVFATGASMQFMPSWLRSALFPEWFEMDFSNMHLAILNSQADLGINLDTSIWTQIMDTWETAINAAGEALGREAMLDEAGIKDLFDGSMNSGNSKTLFFDTSKVDRTALKKALKVSLYSLQFGMTAPAARRGFTGDLLKMGFSRGEATFLGNLWSRDPILQKIASGIKAYCETHAISPSELALRCQAIETTLVKEIYTVARRFKRSDVCITLHSHDGVSVWSRSASVGRKFHARCAARCARLLEKLGIQSRLESKGLPKEVRTEKAPAPKSEVTSCVELALVTERDSRPVATGPP